MTKVIDIYEFIDSFAPFSSSMEFDNTGILIGDKESEVTKVLVSLDVTDKVVDEAIAKDVQLIISHHPIIFHGMKSILADSLQYKLIKNGISVISAHTNLDLSKTMGVNTVFSECLELSESYFVNEKDPIVVGKLKEEMTADEFVKFVGNKLNNKNLRANNKNIDKTISTVAVGGGACGEYVGMVSDLKVDAFVTGELKHHEFLYADEHGLLSIDAGHFYTENIVVSPLAKYLSKAFPKVSFIESETKSVY